MSLASRLPHALVLAAALMLAACGTSREPAGEASPATRAKLATVTVDAEEAARLISAHRAARGLGPVRIDPRLTALAQSQANAMAGANSLSHDVGGSFSSRVASLDAGRSAENLGAGYFSTSEAVEGWKRSAGHNANLLMPQGTRIGIALSKNAGTRYGAWWALLIAEDPPVRREMPVSATTSSYWWGSNAPRR